MGPVDDIRKGARPADAAARCAWWVELHDTKELVHWEQFPNDHVYYIPLSCMVPADADNIVVASSNGTVTLRGSVRSWSERDAAVAAAWATPGVRTVDDHLTLSY